ncbi:MAG: ADP-ribosylglycohydrolase family protein [Planctomycetota bacterium]
MNLMMSTQEYRDTCRAVILGAAIGDAIAFPYKDYSRTFLHALARPISERFGEFGSARHSAGQFSGETQGLLAVCTGIIEARRIDGQTIAEHLAPLWRELTILDPHPANTESLTRFVKGYAEWNDCAHGDGRIDHSALTRSIPLGLWRDIERPEQLADDMRATVGITHSDPLPLACGAGIAAAISFNFGPNDLVLGDFLDHIAAAVAPLHNELAETVQDLPRILTQTDGRAWQLIDELLQSSDHETRLDGCNDYCVPTFILSLYYFLKSPEQYERTLRRVSRLGGEMGPVVTITSAISASRCGLREIPERLKSTLLHRDTIDEVIDDFVDVLLTCSDHAETEAAAERETAVELERGNSEGDDAEDDVDNPPFVIESDLDAPNTESESHRDED